MTLYVHAPVQDAHNINAIRQRKIENQVIPNGETPQPGLKIGAARAHARERGQGQQFFLNTIQKLVGVVGIVLGDIPPDFIKIVFSFWRVSKRAASGLILSLSRGQPLATFPFDLFHIQRRGRAAADPFLNFAPQFLKPQIAQLVALFQEPQRLPHHLAG